MNAIEKDFVTLERTIDAPVEEVWYAWTEPAQVHWFGSDPQGKLVSAHLDVREGGFYEITFQDSDHTEHTCSGIYKEVRRFHKLSFTWTWKSEPGVETLVTVQLSQEGNATRMQFKHANLGTASLHNYESGWKTTFLKLERMLAREM